MGTEVPVHMRLDKIMTGFITTLDPSYKTFVADRGGVTVKLMTALYGPVESSGLWYDNAELRVHMQRDGRLRL
jgi:hypothetical protein